MYPHITSIATKERSIKDFVAQEIIELEIELDTTVLELKKLKSRAINLTLDFHIKRVQNNIRVLDSFKALTLLAYDNLNLAKED